MNTAEVKTQPGTAPRLRLAQFLTAVLIVLAGVASAGGLLIPGLYRDPAGLIPMMKGQDLVTLITLPVMAVTLLAVRRGSPRASLIWLGLLGYLLYTSTGAAFAYRFNPFCLLYVATFSVSVIALVAAATGIQVSVLQRSFDSATPRKPVAVFLVLLALMLAASELSLIIPSLAMGTEPEFITRSGGGGNYVYVLDLGVIMPLSLLSAVWLWRRWPWGYVLAGFILIQTLAMGLALLSATGFSVRAGMPLEAGAAVMYGLLAAGASVMSLWFLRHCRQERGERGEMSRKAPWGLPGSQPAEQ